MLKFILLSMFLHGLLVRSYAQRRSSSSANFWGIKAGYLFSDTQLKANRDNVALSGIRPIDGYYIGGYYQRTEGKRWRSRFDFSYQAKGHRIHGPSGDEATNRYRYLGITPTLGFIPFKNVCIYTGPEATVLITKKTTFTEASRLEFGFVGGMGYEHRRVGVTVTYFRGISKYEVYQGTGFSRPTAFNFLNQNWQLGLTYSFP